MPAPVPLRGISRGNPRCEGLIAGSRRTRFAPREFPASSGRSAACCVPAEAPPPRISPIAATISAAVPVDFSRAAALRVRGRFDPPTGAGGADDGTAVATTAAAPLSRTMSAPSIAAVAVIGARATALLRLKGRAPPRPKPGPRTSSRSSAMLERSAQREETAPRALARLVDLLAASFLAELLWANVLGIPSLCATSEARVRGGE